MTKYQGSEIEKTLQLWGIPYAKQDNGTIVVEGSMDIGHKRLTKLPDLTQVVVKGSFWCNSNQLTSLEGAPAFVGGDFVCSHNKLTSLEGAPSTVKGNFICSGNRLASLTGAPSVVGVSFVCSDNFLTTLEGAPASIGENFWCDKNRLTSLVGAPRTIGRHLLCDDNPLASLEGSPQEFNEIRCDLGTFASWEAVPESLRTSPETKEKVRLETLRKITAAGEKRQTFKPAPSIRFRPK